MRSSGAEARWWWSKIGLQVGLAFAFFVLLLSVGYIPTLVASAWKLLLSESSDGEALRGISLEDALEPVAFEMTNWWDVTVGILAIVVVLISVERIAKWAQGQRNRLKEFRARVVHVFQKVDSGEKCSPEVVRVLGNESYVMHLLKPENDGGGAHVSPFQRQTESIISDFESESSEERVARGTLYALFPGAAIMAGAGLTSLVYASLSDSQAVKGTILWVVAILAVDLSPVALAASQGWEDSASRALSAFRCVTNWSVLSWEYRHSAGSGGEGKNLQLSDATGTWRRYWPSLLLLAAMIILPVGCIALWKPAPDASISGGSIAGYLVITIGMAIIQAAFTQRIGWERGESLLNLIDEYKVISGPGGEWSQNGGNGAEACRPRWSRGTPWMIWAILCAIYTTLFVSISFLAWNWPWGILPAIIFLVVEVALVVWYGALWRLPKKPLTTWDDIRDAKLPSQLWNFVERGGRRRARRAFNTLLRVIDVEQTHAESSRNVDTKLTPTAQASDSPSTSTPSQHQPKIASFGWGIAVALTRMPGGWPRFHLATSSTKSHPDQGK